MDWKELIEQSIKKSKNDLVTLDLSSKSISYSEEIKKHENITSITDEEITRAFLINRLINELGYKSRSLEIEKRFGTTGRKSINKGENDVIVYDTTGNTYLFIEAKSPKKFDSDQHLIESQLFNLAKLQGNVKYLVWYGIEEINNKIYDKAIIIDHIKYSDYKQWNADGRPSVGNMLPAGYGKPEKRKWIKGDPEYDLQRSITRDQISQLATKLHNFLWGGGGTTDTEIFYSLVNIILAKIQDEGEKINGQPYDFQIFGYVGSLEDGESVFNRLNELYKRALQSKMGEKDKNKLNEARIIDRNKFQLNKLIYTVQVLEQYSFIEGRNSLDGRDILGDFFEKITRDGFKQTKGQFFTPTPIVKFILYTLQLDSLSISLLNNEKRLPYVIDPSLGSGTFLVEAMKLITKEVKTRQKNKLFTNSDTKDRFEELFEPAHKENRWARDYLYGIEHNFDLGTSAKVNMILHGDGSSNIFVKDGLLPFRFYENNVKTKDIIQHEEKDVNYFDKDINGAFDIVISNPPFSVALENETKRYTTQSFIFADKKNSENMFIERYYQLLKNGGRIGIVLPESVFDTSENKYIRIFIFKYFNVKAVVSLPQLTFEPYTSTKTSLLFAQKKTANEIEAWQKSWEKYGKEWNALQNKVKNYIRVYLKNENKSKFPSIVNDSELEILNNIKRLLKDILDGNNESSIIELLSRYENEIEKLSEYDKDTKIFGYYNAWWVFGEIVKNDEGKILMAEVEEVGYKRTKRTETITNNELFDLEYAPLELDIKHIYEEIDFLLKDNRLKLHNYEENIKTLNEDLSKIDPKKLKAIQGCQNKLIKLDKIITNLHHRITELEMRKDTIDHVISEYYLKSTNDIYTLKSEYSDRIDKDLLSFFKEDGILFDHSSQDIVLRQKTKLKLLDYLRNEIIWQ